MKRLIVLFLSVIMILSVLPICAFAEAYEKEDWEINISCAASVKLPNSFKRTKALSHSICILNLKSVPEKSIPL